MAITFFGVSIFILAKAFPENTVFVTSKPFCKSGKVHAPVTIPASSFTATAGAIAFPLILCAKTITSAFKFVAAVAIKLA